MPTYIHHVNANRTNILDTFKMDIPDSFTFEHLKVVIARDKKLHPQQIKISQNINQQEVKQTSQIVNNLIDSNNQLFVQIVDLPVKKQDVVYEKKEEHFSKIEKYTFYEGDEWNVKVLLELKGIEKVDQSNFSARFFERSFELKIRNYEGKNWLFGIGKTHYKINPEQCKFNVKTNKIYITLRKIKKDDHWFSLYKTRTIGGDSD